MEWRIIVSEIWEEAVLWDGLNVFFENCCRLDDELFLFWRETCNEIEKIWEMDGLGIEFVFSRLL